MSLPKDLVAASATPIILAILSEEDSYGYAIIEKVRQVSGGEMEWADGMLYPILHRLEKKGFVKSYFRAAETGRQRKYYKLCKSGQKELGMLRQQWNTLHGILGNLGGASSCPA